MYKFLKYFMLSIALISMMACSGGSDSKDSVVTPPPPPVDTPPADTPPPVEEDRSITIYLHGFSQTGYKRSGIYGANEVINADPELAKLVGFSTNYQGADTNFKENVIVSTSYYGDQPPEYYSQKDIEDIDAITAQYGGGIPRYAMIVAKYARHIISESGATKINFMSVSMGSLVSRWIIEQNVENLAFEKRIGKWLSVEGVVAGNYAASDPVLVRIANLYEEQSPEVEHMSYSWIESNLGSRRVTSSLYYGDIQVGFESSTDDNDMERVLTKYLLLKGRYIPNDGYQLVEDTLFSISDQLNYFNSLTPIRSYFHETHTGLKDNSAAWAQSALFFSSKRRVKVTLTHARVDDIHEEDSLQPAEIVFASSVKSPQLAEVSHITQAVDRRDIDGGALTIQTYHNNGENIILNQTVFDGFVRTDEIALTITIDGYEIDNSIKYNIKESSQNQIEDIGGVLFNIPLQNGTHPVVAKDWSGEVRVEIYPY